MAQTRRGLVFATCVSSIICVLLLLVTISTDSWIVATATTDIQTEDSTVQYGLFRGKFIQRILDTPTENDLYMTCVAELNACAVSCKLDSEQRKLEISKGIGTKDQVRALANGFRPNPTCTASASPIDESNPFEHAPIIPFAVYICLLIILFLQLVFAVISAGLAILNATSNPMEPIFGLPGCIWANVSTFALGMIALLLFGIYYAVSNFQEHLAFSHISVGIFAAGAGLGYSFWILIVSTLCSAGNVGMLHLRKYLLEKDPPPPTIKVENHSDGTVFLY